MKKPECIIRFPQGKLLELRRELLKDSSREAFAVLIGKKREIGEHCIIVVGDVYYPQPSEYINQSRTQLRMKKSFIYRVMAEAQTRPNVDTIIDVHTHPFTDRAWFSQQDDVDEINYFQFLDSEELPFSYGSIVLSQKTGQARMWYMNNLRPEYKVAAIKTQTALEALPTTENESDILDDEQKSRTLLSLGVDTMRRIIADQCIVLAGVGGLGSVMAENLVHQGFEHLVLIDNDILDHSSLNRFVGGTFDDAEKKRPKVEVVASHLQAINPQANVETVFKQVDSLEAEEKMALADWILLSTDNHTSRYQVQKAALTYGVPLISAGVNITVRHENGRHVIVDRSGEVIVVRLGDHFCLNCLGRINLALLSAESHPDPEVRAKTISRGYVLGAEVKEPAVKTLNSVIGAMAIESLTNQYKEDMIHEPILVYESHHGLCMYPDRSTFSLLETGCASCH
ncbi:MAG: ThiF family adenylyltransferase [Deltaproteobacteria bacterium]|jgi:hypothetical protein|nr:ThiF family adenylyltransferase [Deltaproteobacteria bacterium]